MSALSFKINSYGHLTITALSDGAEIYVQTDVETTLSYLSEEDQEHVRSGYMVIVDLTAFDHLFEDCDQISE